MRAHSVLPAAFLLLILATSGPAPGQVHRSALEPPDSGGLATLDRALVKLSSHRRLLVVGAHPDDEDNALLSYVSHGLGGDVGYLSLSRGEGGQNLIGKELGTELGIVRTGELLAARALEDGRQFFTRAFDFGYTRSLEETFQRWPRDVLQGDAVRVARRFKPQVIVAIFPASEQARHGQHQASAVIARDVFDLAGDPSFSDPSLMDGGLEPWQPAVLYRRSWGLGEATLSFSLGDLETIAGRSYGQLAAASRSMHRSQDMGRVQQIGEFRGGLVWLEGGAGETASHIFDGIDTRLAAIAAPIIDDAKRESLEAILSEVERLAVETRKQLSPVALGAQIPSVGRLVDLLRQAAEIASQSGSQAVEDLVTEKQSLGHLALAAAAGVVLDARVDRETIPTGGSASLELEIWSPGEAPVEVHGVDVVSDPGWIVGELAENDAADDETGVRRWTAPVQVSRGATPGAPYFLASPLEGDLYDWSGAPESVLGEPFARPPLVAVFNLEVAGTTIRIEREVVYRYGDQAFGEIRRPIRAVPPLEVELKSRSLLWIRGKTNEATLEVVVRSNLEAPVAGDLTLDLPAEWTVAGDLSFRIDQAGGSVARSLRLRTEVTPAVGRYGFRVEATSGDLSVGGSFPQLEYPHVRPRTVPREAAFEVSVLDLELPVLDRVGYVLGASDRVPPVLEALGLPIAVLSQEDLRLGDLDGFDAIIIGSRAYETDEALRSSNPRLLEYVSQGGTLIVQYQQYQFVRGEYAPFALEIARPHGRVTDERAPVSLLEPAHPLFNQPNAIGDDDWNGWVQERGLYFPGTWDQRYRPLLAMRDTGRDEERGALLVAEYGDGIYIYSGLSFFRQLPAGIPGAIRLFANLLASAQGDIQ